MKKANFIKAILTMLLVASTASAAGVGCTKITWEKEFKRLDRNMEPLEVVVLNDCTSEAEYSVITDPDYSSHAEPNEFTLPPGISKKLLVFVDTAKLSGGTHEYNLKVIAGDSSTVTSAAFKVPEQEGPSLAVRPVNDYKVTSLPSEVSFEARNYGNKDIDGAVLNALGESKVMSIPAGEKVTRTFAVSDFDQGTHEIKGTLSYGDFKRNAYVTLKVIGSNYPLGTKIDIDSQAKDNQYKIIYWMENTGTETLDGVQAKVSDAPSDWKVINPGEVSLAPGETITQTITLRYGESDPKSSVTVSVTSEKGLILQEGVDLAKAYTQPVTGFFGLGGNLELGLLFIALVIVLYAGYKKRDRIREAFSDIQF